MIYFDATFLVRLYIEESGFDLVREVAATTDQVASSILGKMETGAAMHRHLREKKISLLAFQEVYLQFIQEQEEDLFKWAPLTPTVIESVHRTFLDLPADVYLRTGDAIHLATAAEAGFKEIYSNDKHLLAAAPVFKLKGVNPLAKQR